jgi:hypothetical protein
MQADFAHQSMPVRQFTSLVKAGHIGHQRRTRDGVIFECLYDSPVDLRTHPTSSAFTIIFALVLGRALIRRR